MKFTLFAAAAAAFVIPETWANSQLVLEDADTAKPVKLVKPVKPVKPAPTLTVYQLISSSEDTTEFAALVDQHADLVEILNSTAANHTVFVPVDTAFAELPAGLPNDTAAVRDLISYHVGIGAFPFSIMFNLHTVPTLLDEPLLGGEPQRLRLRFEKALGLGINFDSHVVTKDLTATNGVVHTVDSVIIPPSMVGSELVLKPADFSTYLLGMEKTGFAEFIHGLQLTGSTVLAPSNMAFTKLGPKVNAFLFDTPEGLKYLKALLKYSVAPNSTVYSDAYYGPIPEAVGSEAAAAGGSSGSGGSGGVPVVRRHYDLPTLLDGATVSVNVTTYPGYSVILVNTIASVHVPDIVAKNGVIQEVSSVVFPPPPMPNGTVGGYPWWKYRKVTTVADVIERLGPYVDEDDSASVDPVAEDRKDISDL